MVAKEYLLMLECVERGTAIGVSRAHKHSDNPSKDAIERSIVENVMNEICERWAFNDVPGE